MASQGSLQRRLGLADAVVVGAGSMIGAGVFAAWSPAAGAAGTALIVGLALAGFVAWCNATSSAQLAAIHPESGGTYVYGRRQLGPAWGHLAGWGFVVGKTASCAAMALAIGAYVWPEQERWVGIAAVIAIGAVNVGGLERTVLVTRILLGVSLATLLVVVIAAWSDDGTSLERITPIEASPYEILQSAGLLFFAFAGYARIATLGEEVIDPARTIPRAIPVALAVTLAVYGLVAVSALLAVDVDQLARAAAPLAVAVKAGQKAWLAPAVQVGATVASLGVLLSLIVGVSRTVFAMAAHRDLPSFLAAVHPRFRVPRRAELAVGVIVAAVVAVADVRSAIGFSSFAVLTYYAVTNAAALKLTAAERRWPRGIAVAGLIGCAALAVSLPVASVVSGGALLVVGAAVFSLRQRPRA